jgi:hypothetical protein
MEPKKKATLDHVLEQFNPYHNDKEEESAWTLIQHKREVFSDLLIHAMNPESQDVRGWDDARWQALVSFAEDFNNFLRSLEAYYRENRSNVATPNRRERSASL